MVHWRAAGGGALAARSISSILSKYPNQKAIPWHRIVYAGGKIWFTEEYENKRREMCELEEIKIDRKGRIVDFSELA